MPNRHAVSRQLSLGWWALFLVGLLIAVAMALHARVGGDQRLMLELGWELVANGEWLQYGMPTSAGGRSPGGFAALVVALPLSIWQDYRSVALFTVVLHTLAFFMLLRTVRPALTTHAIWLLLVFVWLNPWRLYYSAHVWNVNFMFVLAILHLWSARRMAVGRKPIDTCLHVVLVAAAMQLHTSAAILALLSLLLFWRRAIQVHWAGFAVGVVAGISLYVPWAIYVAAEPDLAPGEKGFFLRGLLLVFPFVRGVLYTVKMASLSMPSRTMHFDFSNLLGDSAEAWLIPVGTALAYLAHVSLVPAIWSHWRFVRQMWPRILRFRHRPIGAVAPRTWLRNYMMLALLAALVSFAISPTTVMFWQAFVVLPVASLALTMLTESLLRTRLATWTRRGTVAWAVLAIMIATLQSVGAPKYRCAGNGATSDDPMQRDLHIPASCIQLTEAE